MEKRKWNRDLNQQQKWNELTLFWGELLTKSPVCHPHLIKIWSLEQPGVSLYINIVGGHGFPYPDSYGNIISLDQYSKGFMRKKYKKIWLEKCVLLAHCQVFIRYCQSTENLALLDPYFLLLSFVEKSTCPQYGLEGSGRSSCSIARRKGFAVVTRRISQFSKPKSRLPLYVSLRFSLCVVCFRADCCIPPANSPVKVGSRPVALKCNANYRFHTTWKCKKHP